MLILLCSGVLLMVFGFLLIWDLDEVNRQDRKSDKLYKDRYYGRQSRSNYRS